MTRSLSDDFKAIMFSQDTTESVHILLKIDHDDLSEPIYVVNNTETVTSNGIEYLPYHFEVGLPDEIEDRVPDVELVIDNVDRVIVQAIRSLGTAPTVTLSVVRSGDWDTVEMGPIPFTVRESRFDALVVESSLRFERVQDNRYPKKCMDPNLYPGLHGGRPEGAEDWPPRQAAGEDAARPVRAWPFRHARRGGRPRRWRR